MTPTTALPPSDTDTDAPPALRVALTAGAMALPFVLWWAFIRATGVPEMIAKTPWGVVDCLFLADTSALARTKLIDALMQTQPITALGMVAGLGFAFLLAISNRMIPGFIRAFMPIALVTQTMPLVALTPLLVLMLGRGLSVTLWITISVTFFPAFVLLVQGIRRAPQSVLYLPPPMAPRPGKNCGWRRSPPP